MTPLALRMHRLFILYCITVSIAGIQLYIFATRTADYFAWTINPPVTAAFLGASYWGSLPMLIVAARAKSWENARISFFGVFVFSIMTLAATIHHRDRFHFGDESLQPLIAAWVWLAIYLLVPLLSVIALAHQLRARGESERGALAPLWLLALVAAQGIVLVVYGALLFWKPPDYAEHWPWQLSPLTARAVAAWLVGMGIHAVHAALERRLSRIMPLMYAYLAFCATQAGLLLRFEEYFDWGSTSARVYASFLVTIGIAGLGAIAARRQSR